MSRTRTLIAVFIGVFVLAGLSSSAFAAGPKKVEITIFGGYQMFNGTGTVENVASDLLTDAWSPWFGKGYSDFNWIGSLVPKKIDEYVGNPLLEQKGGPSIGLQLGFNITPAVQIELFFSFVPAKMQIMDTAWTAINKSFTDGFNACQAFGLSPEKADESVRTAGSILQYGLNLNFNLISSGSFIPYLSVGAFANSYGDTPAISFWWKNNWGGANVSYGLDVTYMKKTVFGFGGGVGGKYYISPAMGIKFEIRGNYIPFRIDQVVTTTFNPQPAGDFTPYKAYNKTAANEKIGLLAFGGSIGFFFDL